LNVTVPMNDSQEFRRQLSVGAREMRRYAIPRDGNSREYSAMRWRRENGSGE